MVRLRNALAAAAGYAGEEPVGAPVRSRAWGFVIVQTAQPRDVAALVLVVGLFLILFVVTVLVGAPVR